MLVGLGGILLLSDCRHPSSEVHSSGLSLPCRYKAETTGINH